MTIPDAVDHLKCLMIQEALRRNNGNDTRAARYLRMTRRGLQLLLSRYQLSHDE